MPRPHPTRVVISDKSTTISVTDRESEVAILVAEGLTNKQIADRLSISERTAEAHVSNILAYNNLHNRSALVAIIARASVINDK